MCAGVGVNRRRGRPPPACATTAGVRINSYGACVSTDTVLTGLLGAYSTALLLDKPRKPGAKQP